MDKMNLKTMTLSLLTSCLVLPPLYGEEKTEVPDAFVEWILETNDNKFVVQEDETELVVSADEPAEENETIPQTDAVEPEVEPEPVGQVAPLKPVARAHNSHLKTDPNQPVLYYADTQTYDRELGILILKGHVEFDHLGNVLEADYVTYNENSDIVTASGNVRLRQTNGEVNFADYLELTGDMKEGIVLQLRTLLDDDSKIAALEGRKFEDRQELERAVYTPCELCGDKLPTWQLNARRAVKDDVNKDIVFTDAEFRFLDTPLLYLPYATQPLERRSGFLLPKPGYTSDMGALLQIPYYIVLSEDKDMTLTPVFFTEQNPLLFGEYRQAFGSGIFNVEGSITKYNKTSGDKKKEKATKNFHIPEVRGHIFGTYKQNLNDIWRLKLDGGYVSDKTYFRKYKISGWRTQNALTSRGILEGFLNQRDYAALKAYYFQGLRVNLDHQKYIAAPIPMVEYSAYSETDPLGGRFKFDGNLLNLYRQKGLNMQRGIGEVSWQRPWNTMGGQLYTPFASLRGDLYAVEHGRKLGHRDKQLQLEKRHHRDGGARFFPEIGMNWRWPFLNSLCGQSYVLSPVAQIVGSPSHPIGASNHKIPNEDSQAPEFNDANLFSVDRFPGYDRIDRGSRAVYGGEVLMTGKLFGDISLFLGESYSFPRHQPDRRIKGLNRQASDYVGRLDVNPYEWLSFNYRFRLDQKTFNWRIVEMGGALGPEIAQLSGTYLFVSKHAGTPENNNISQANFTFSSHFTKHWTFFAKMIKNFHKRTPAETRQGLDNHHGILSKGVGLAYRDDCFGLSLAVTRQNYRSVDVKPATVVMLSLWLKNLGDYPFSFNPDLGVFGDRKPSKTTP
jgi:LPS-assembly protein